MLLLPSPLLIPPSNREQLHRLKQLNSLQRRDQQRCERLLRRMGISDLPVERIVERTGLYKKMGAAHQQVAYCLADLEYLADNRFVERNENSATSRVFWRVAYPHEH